MHCRSRLVPPATFVLVALLLAAPGSADAAIIWKADFEPGDLSQWNGNVNAVKGPRKNIEFVADPVQEGKTAAKFTIHPDDTFNGSQQRVQVTQNKAATGEGADTFMSWYFFLAADPLIRDNIAYWESNSSYRNMMTWWVAPKAGGGTTINFGTESLGRVMRWSQDMAINKWHQLAVHIHWSVNPQVGAIKMFFDGAMVLDIKVQTKADGNTLFFQAGYHRANVSSMVDSYFVDNFVQADTLAEVLAPPSPGGTDGGASSDGSAGGDSSDGGAGGSGGSAASGSGGSGGSAPGGSGGAGGSVSGSGGSVGGGSGGSITGGGGTSGRDAGGNPPQVEGGAPACAVGPSGAPTECGFAVMIALVGAALLIRRRARRE